MSHSSPIIRWLMMAGLSLAFLFIAGGLAYTMWIFREKPEKKEVVEVLPTVETLTVYPESIQLEVEAQGTVEARTETQLTAEVSGLVEWVAPSFEDGGFFEEGQILLRIDPLEYEARLAEAKSQLAQARLAFEQEKALAEQARQDWLELGRGEASDLVLREPQLARAQANLEAAEAALKIAERNLRFTRVRAPYAGRIRSKLVDLGQAVNARTTPLADIYSVEQAQIRLPLSSDQMGFLQLPESYRKQEEAGPQPEVVLQADYGGQRHRWTGKIVRTEGAIDPRSRLVNVIAEVEDPYSIREFDGEIRPPLKVGLFVEARIEGEKIPDAFRIPRSALKDGDQVYILGAENRLESRKVGVVKRDADLVIVNSGLNPGDRLCLTPLLFFVEGMQVLPVDEAGAVEESVRPTQPDKNLEVAESEKEDTEA